MSTRTEASPAGRSGFDAARGGLLAILISIFGLLGACASTGSSPGTPIDGRDVALRAEAASTLDRPYRLVFDWSLSEPGARFSGQGVARVEPPGNVRLDLFTRRGERVAVAALVGDELRLPRYDQVELPPAAFLWASLGVFLPEGAAPGEGRALGNGVSELRYARANGEELVYRFSDDRIEGMQAVRDGRAREELRLVRTDGESFPHEAIYRHLEDVRELRITLESVEHVESHPTDIWDPGA